METLPGRKKRKPNPIDGDDQGPPDRISGLPDCVLGHIVSLLPTADGARTQALSSRWRRLWRAAPLNLDCHGFGGVAGARAACVNLLSRARRAHGGPVRRLVLSTPSNPAAHPYLDRFLDSPALDGLRELEFFYTRSTAPPQPPFPPQARRLASTLAVASFGFCHFSEEAAGSLVFPVLKHLQLAEVSISEDALRSLLASCRVLESLQLARNHGFRRFGLISRSLRSIGVSVGASLGEEVVLEELIIEDTPCLERLLFPMLLCRLHVRVIAAPKLEVLGWLPDFHPRLNLGIDVPRLDDGDALREDFSSAHTASFSGILDVVINLMTYFPCLKTLYISSVNRGDEQSNLWHAEQLARIECINHHLKKIILSGYVMSCMSQVNFIKFFVLNARVLQLMRLEIPPGMPAAWIERQHELLQLKDRASSNAQFDFPTDSWLCCPVNLKWVSDFSRADPFLWSSQDCA